MCRPGPYGFPCSHSGQYLGFFHTGILASQFPQMMTVERLSTCQWLGPWCMRDARTRVFFFSFSRSPMETTVSSPDRHCFAQLPALCPTGQSSRDTEYVYSSLDAPLKKSAPWVVAIRVSPRDSTSRMEPVFRVSISA